MGNRTTCPHCGNLLVESYGPQSASILLIVDSPNYDEIREGRLGARRVGDILRAELARGGIQFASCRLISMWKHGKNKDCNADYHIELMTKEIQGHDWVILMGSEVSKLLTGYGILDIIGLQVKSKLFPKVKMFALPNAGSLMRGDVGEMRLGLEKFNELRRKKK